MRTPYEVIAHIKYDFWFYSLFFKWRHLIMSIDDALSMTLCSK